MITDPGEWVEAECRELGVSMHHVALEARVSPSTVQRWAAGKTTPYWHAYERVRGVLERIRREREPSFWSRGA